MPHGKNKNKGADFEDAVRWWGQKGVWLLASLCSPVSPWFSPLSVVVAPTTTLLILPPSVSLPLPVLEGLALQCFPSVPQSPSLTQTYP